MSDSKTTFTRTGYGRTYSMTTDAETLTDIIEDFELFLRGAGYGFDGYLDIVEHEKPEETQGIEITKEMIDEFANQVRTTGYAQSWPMPSGKVTIPVNAGGLSGTTTFTTTVPNGGYSSVTINGVSSDGVEHNKYYFDTERNK